MYNLKTKEFLVSRDLVFYENVFPFNENLETTLMQPDRNMNPYHQISHFDDDILSFNGENQDKSKENPAITAETEQDSEAAEFLHNDHNEGEMETLQQETVLTQPRTRTSCIF